MQKEKAIAPAMAFFVVPWHNNICTHPPMRLTQRFCSRRLSVTDLRTWAWSPKLYPRFYSRTHQGSRSSSCIPMWLFPLPRWSCRWEPYQASFRTRNFGLLPMAARSDSRMSVNNDFTLINSLLPLVIRASTLFELVVTTQSTVTGKMTTRPTRLIKSIVLATSHSFCVMQFVFGLCVKN